MRNKEIAVIYNENHKNHITRKEDPCELSQRIEVIKKALLSPNLILHQKSLFYMDHHWIKECHSVGMVYRIKTYSQIVQDGDEVFTKFYYLGNNSNSTPIRRGTYY